MKLALPKFRLPKLHLPKLGRSKSESERREGALLGSELFESDLPDSDPAEPDFAESDLSGLDLSKPTRRKFAIKGRHLLIGASALALLGAGALAYFFVRPMLAGHKEPAQETALGAMDKAATAPQEDASKTDKTPQDASKVATQNTPHDKPAEAPKSEGGAANQTPDEKPEQKAEAKSEGDVVKAQDKDEKGEKPEKSGKEEKTSAPLPPPPPPSEVERLIRRLQDIQERVAAGDAASYAEMPRLLHMIGQKFAEAPPETWSNKQNARALVLYLLSGGGSTLGRTILRQHKFAPSEEPLAKAAVAYLEGVEGADHDYLLTLNPRELDLDLGAQIAFVQSILQTGSDRPKAIASLDLARLLAPGGLVEEAALRRETALLSETTQFDKFAELARQYWQRFRASPYADNFLRQFMSAVARVSLLIKPSEWAQLEEFISSLNTETRLKLYLVMAQASAVGGNVGLADMAAQRALDMAAEGSVERQRALLYRAAAQVGAADPVHGAKLLVDVARDRLLAADQPLYDAVATAAARIYRDPERNFAAPPPGDPNDIDASLSRAEKGVKEADAAMASVTKTMERKTR